MDEEPYIAPDDLLACPFCGGEASVSEGSKKGGEPWWYIECIDCASTAESVDVWNKRTYAATLPQGSNE